MDERIQQNHKETYQMSETPLSQRIRPGSEAAPWVCDEIARIERDLADANSGNWYGAGIKIALAASPFQQSLSDWKRMMPKS